MIDNRLITFLTVAKIKNYTKASQILNLTQPAVSQHIKFLEEYYGVKFIKKNGKNIYLTEEGKELLKYAKEVELKERIFYRNIKNKFNIIKHYNIGATMTIGGYVIPYILGEYKELHSNIEFIFRVSNTKNILKKLLKEEIDLGVVEGPFNKNQFKYEKFKDDELVLAVSYKHHFNKKDQVELSEVLKGKLILREEGSGTRKFFEKGIMKIGYSIKDLNVYMEVDSIDAIKALVEANLGYTIISKEAIKKEIELGTIKVIPIKDVNFYREFNFVYLKNNENEFLDDFINFCLNKL